MTSVVMSASLSSVAYQKEGIEKRIDDAIRKVDAISILPKDAEVAADFLKNAFNHINVALQLGLLKVRHLRNNEVVGINFKNGPLPTALLLPRAGCEISVLHAVFQYAQKLQEQGELTKAEPELAECLRLLEQMAIVTYVLADDPYVHNNLTQRIQACRGAFREDNLSQVTRNKAKLVVKNWQGYQGNRHKLAGRLKELSEQGEFRGDDEVLQWLYDFIKTEHEYLRECFQALIDHKPGIAQTALLKFTEFLNYCCDSNSGQQLQQLFYRLRNREKTVGKVTNAEEKKITFVCERGFEKLIQRAGACVVLLHPYSDMNLGDYLEEGALGARKFAEYILPGLDKNSKATPFLERKRIVDASEQPDAASSLQRTRPRTQHIPTQKHAVQPNTPLITIEIGRIANELSTALTTYERSKLTGIRAMANFLTNDIAVLELERSEARQIKLAHQRLIVELEKEAPQVAFRLMWAVERPLRYMLGQFDDYDTPPPVLSQCLNAWEDLMLGIYELQLSDCVSQTFAELMQAVAQYETKFTLFEESLAAGDAEHNLPQLRAAGVAIVSGLRSATSVLGFFYSSEEIIAPLPGSAEVGKTLHELQIKVIELERTMDIDRLTDRLNVNLADMMWGKLQETARRCMDFAASYLIEQLCQPGKNGSPLAKPSVPALKDKIRFLREQPRAEGSLKSYIDHVVAVYASLYEVAPDNWQACTAQIGELSELLMRTPKGETLEYKTFCGWLRRALSYFINKFARFF